MSGSPWAPPARRAVGVQRLLSVAGVERLSGVGQGVIGQALCVGDS
jgi:hypothetical protein